MNNPASLLLEVAAAKRRLAESCQFEALAPAGDRGALIAPDNPGRAVRKHAQEGRRSISAGWDEGARVRYRAGTASPVEKPAQSNRDMPVSTFLLALVFVGVLLAANTDRPHRITPLYEAIGASPETGPLPTAAHPEIEPTVFGCGPHH
jgi:hypothetical protein